MRTLRLANNPLLTDHAFPSLLKDEETALILRHPANNLRVLDLTSCRITDEAVRGIVTHAPRIQSLILSGCTLLTDRAVEAICILGGHLDVLMLAHVSNVTDAAVIQVARSCSNLRCIDVACRLHGCSGKDD